VGILVSDLRMKVTSWGEVLLDTREVNALMRSAGNDVKNKTARLIARSSGGGRNYQMPGGGSRYRASSAGDPPVRRTGTLRSSLKSYVLKAKVGFAVRAREFYALFLESGAKGGGNPGTRGVALNPRTGRRRRARGIYTRRVLAPRPFLDRVMAQEAPELDRRVRLALTQALKWKQTK
jgi:hypothetical protein